MNIPSCGTAAGCHVTATRRGVDAIRLPPHTDDEMVIPGSDPERSYICDIKPYTGETFWRLRICADGETKFDTSRERRTWGKHFDWMCVRGKWDKVPSTPARK